MKYKYLMITGLAFSEQGDMNRLGFYARQGWILESIKGCTLYKLKKSEPKNIIYSVDYQCDADDEYFSLFKRAGWNHVLTSQKFIHIFSAEQGTEPIYSDRDSEISKYMPIKDKTKKAAIIFGILSLLMAVMTTISAVYMRKLFLLSIILTAIIVILFIVNLMPYIAYSGRIKEIEKYGKCLGDDSAAKKIYIVNMVLGILVLAMAVVDFRTKKTYSLIGSFVIGLCNISLGCRYFKNTKKRKQK